VKSVVRALAATPDGCLVRDGGSRSDREQVPAGFVLVSEEETGRLRFV